MQSSKLSVHSITHLKQDMGSMDEWMDGWINEWMDG